MDIKHEDGSVTLTIPTPELILLRDLVSMGFCSWAGDRVTDVKPLDYEDDEQEQEHALTMLSALRTATKLSLFVDNTGMIEREEILRLAGLSSVEYHNEQRKEIPA